MQLNRSQHEGNQVQVSTTRLMSSVWNLPRWSIFSCNDTATPNEVEHSRESCSGRGQASDSTPKCLALLVICTPFFILPSKLSYQETILLLPRRLQRHLRDARFYADRSFSRRQAESQQQEESSLALSPKGSCLLPSCGSCARTFRGGGLTRGCRLVRCLQMAPFYKWAAAWHFD